MKCYYHADKDGQCAGFWVYFKRLAIAEAKTKDDFIIMDYTKTIDFDSIEPDEEIWIVDFSISPDDMRKLLQITKNVTWIDHHKTAIEKYKDFEYDIRGVRYDGVSGAMLTYCYLHHMTQRGEGNIKPFDMSMIQDAPLFTKLVDDWDVWKFEFGDDTRLFQLGTKSYNFHPTSQKWLELYRSEIEIKKLIEEGKIIKQYSDHQNKNYMHLGFETKFEKYKCFAANIGYANSEYFKSLHDKGYDIFISFVYNGKEWIHSLYTLNKDIDVSLIAKKYSGGDHRGAAGFQTKSMLIKKGKVRLWRSIMVRLINRFL